MPACACARVLHSAFGFVRGCVPLQERAGGAAGLQSGGLSPSREAMSAARQVGCTIRRFAANAAQAASCVVVHVCAKCSPTGKCVGN
jgi:hypothetical protein